MGIAGNSMLAGNLGAVETVVAWMFENSACEGLQERACAALQKFTTHDIDNDNEIRARKVGGIGAVSGSGVARALHKDSGKVPHPACAALRKLTGGNAEGASWAGNVGAIEALVVVMHQHLGSTGVQEQACAALYNLVIGNVRNRTLARNAGIKAPAEAALKTHLGNVVVVVKARDLLKQINARTFSFQGHPIST